MSGNSLISVNTIYVQDMYTHCKKYTPKLKKYYSISFADLAVLCQVEDEIDELHVVALEVS